MGLLGAIIIGITFSMMHAFASVTKQGNQVVSCVAINIFAIGLTTVLGQAWFQRGGKTPQLPPEARFTTIELPFAEELRVVPVLGDIYYELISGHNILVYIAYIMVPLTAWIVFRSRFGLRLRATGENPLAVDTAGISVNATRYKALIINGILAGLVSVTAGCGDLTFAGAWFAGLVGGIIVVFAVAALDASGIDDPVGAFSVHGVCGVWGTLVIGLWGFDVQGDGSPLGLLVGGGVEQLGIQALGTAAYAIWTVVTCFIAWQIIGALFGGIRVTEQEETEGLDIGEHGMEAYAGFSTTNN